MYFDTMNNQEDTRGIHKYNNRTGCEKSNPYAKAVLIFIILLMQCVPQFNLPRCDGIAEGWPVSSAEEAAIGTGLMTICIHTENGEFPTFKEADSPEGMLGASIKDNAYVKGYCEIANLDSGQRFASRMKLKVRGNTSARFAGPDGKQPYKLVLKEAVDLYGNGHWDKKYILLSWAGENLNTYLGFRIGQYCGMKWNPDCRYVNLVINDDYRGIYLLVPALDGVSRLEHVGSNGFMVECDAYWWKEDIYFRTDGIAETMAFTVKYPDVDLLNDARLEKIKKYMDRVSGEIVDKGSSDLIDWIPLSPGLWRGISAER